jgi:FlaA1/EpsC-like NDP-sugar epimerase
LAGEPGAYLKPSASESSPVSSRKGTERPVGWSKLLNRWVQLGMDLIVLSSAFTLAYLLRFEFALSEELGRSLLIQLPFVLLVQFSALFIAGCYTVVWRYIGMAELLLFGRAAFWSGAVLIVLRLGLPSAFQDWRIPLSIILMATVFAFGGTLALRVIRRFLFERYERQETERLSGTNGKKRVFLVGAGRAGVLAAKEIGSRGDMGLTVCGFIDDDPQKLNTVIHGIKVIGTSSELPRLAEERDIDHVIITIATASRKDIRDILGVCDAAGVRARIIPGLFEILSGSVEVSRIRDVQIEDLLGREPVELDEGEIRSFIADNTVMITGAGGSIGSEMCRQVARFGVRQLLLVERAEFALFDIDRELRSAMPGLDIVPLVADVCDSDRMDEIFTRFNPRVVIHAAAHKHVPLMESNITEAMKNNVFATRKLAELAGHHAVETFVQVSTDKAVRPTSIMGASKRFAELAIQGLGERFNTRYVSVRFGNVLGSAGSVIPIFREQIHSGGPVTVTHPDMVRYFMTIPEASQLVLQAAAIGEGGEIFILDMGEPVKIVDLAADMIRLSGLTPNEDIDIKFTGVRPGEKLFEELLGIDEETASTQHPKIFVGRVQSYPEDRVEGGLKRLQELVESVDVEGLKRFLSDFLPEARLDSPLGNQADSSDTSPVVGHGVANPVGPMAKT